MKKTGAKGLGYSPNDVSDEVNKASKNRIRRNTKASDAWRKAKEEDPRLEFRMSFVDFKKLYFRPKKKNFESLSRAPENKKSKKRV